MELSMDLSLSQKQVKIIVMVGCALLVLILAKSMLFGLGGELARGREQVEAAQAKVDSLTKEWKRLQKMVASAEAPQTVEDDGDALQGDSTRQALWEKLLPNSLIATSSVRGFTIGTSSQEGSLGAYPFGLEFTEVYERACEYFVVLERELPNLVLSNVSVEPWKKDPSRLHVKLSGGFANLASPE